MRVYGRHDNTGNIVDANLAWASVLQPVTSAATHRMGSSPTGMIAGSRVFGYYLDESEQYPIILGSFARSGSPTDANDNTMGLDAIITANSDLPWAAQDRGLQGVGGGASDPDGTSTSQTSNTENTQYQSARLNATNRYDFTSIPEYNNAAYVEQRKAVEHTNTSRQEHFAYSANLPTLALITKQQSTNYGYSPPDVLKMTQAVDPQFKSEVLPQAVTNFQKVFETSGNGQSSNSNMMNQTTSSTLQNLGSQMGVPTVVSSLATALQVPLSTQQTRACTTYSSSSTNLSMYACTGPPATSSTTTTTPVYGTTANLNANQVHNTADAIMNQLQNYGTGNENSTVAAMAANTVVMLGNALRNLLSRTSANLQVTLPPSQPNTAITPPGTVYATVNALPNGYSRLYTSAAQDPFPGYTVWIAANGSVAFVPSAAPYSPTPMSEAVAVAEAVLLPRLANLISSNTLTTTNLERALQSAATVGMQTLTTAQDNLAAAALLASTPIIAPADGSYFNYATPPDSTNPSVNTGAFTGNTPTSTGGCTTPSTGGCTTPSTGGCTTPTTTGNASSNTSNTANTSNTSANNRPPVVVVPPPPPGQGSSSNFNLGDIMGFLMQLIQLVTGTHIPDSWLNPGTMNPMIQDYQKMMQVARTRQSYGWKAVANTMEQPQWGEYSGLPNPQQTQVPVADQQGGDSAAGGGTTTTIGTTEVTST